MLSPYTICEISIREVAKSIENVNTEDAEIFYKELVWREFPIICSITSSFGGYNSKEIDNFKWLDNQDHLECWQKGMTGYPIIDAARGSYMKQAICITEDDSGKFFGENLMIH